MAEADAPPAEPEIAALPDREALRLLRAHRPARRRVHGGSLPMGARVADALARTVGSWPFIVAQSAALVLWIGANICGWVQSWDPYPFILLNLALSFQAAYAAPIIMMAQNRQAEIDRRRARQDYDVNLKAELEIEALHQKIDALRAELAAISSR